jgi:chromosome segregation ATPase
VDDSPPDAAHARLQDALGELVDARSDTEAALAALRLTEERLRASEARAALLGADLRTAHSDLGAHRGTILAREAEIEALVPRCRELERRLADREASVDRLLPPGSVRRRAVDLARRAGAL